MRVLVVGGNDTSAVVRELGHEPLAASTNAQAIRQAVTWKPDLLLVDLTKFDGINLAKNLRANSHRMPLIGIASYMSSAERHEAIEAGFDEFLAKPYKSNELDGILVRVEARVIESRTIAERTRVFAQMTREMNRKSRGA